MDENILAGSKDATISMLRGQRTGCGCVCRGNYADGQDAGTGERG